MSEAGVYVFGIVAADHPCRLSGLTGIGGAAGAPRRMAAGPTAAVVGAVPANLRAKRRDLIAHQEVLDRLCRPGPVLPMRFGVVVASEEQLRAELARSRRRHLDALAELAGRTEINVKVVPDEDAMLRVVATEDPSVRRLRARGGQAYLDQLRLGEAVANAVRKRSEGDADLVLRTLKPYAVRTASGPPVEGCALNTSFLVEDGQVDELLDRVADLDDKLGGLCRVRASGRIPPYSFAEPRGR
jgi:hypothetical protein